MNRAMPVVVLLLGTLAGVPAHAASDERAVKIAEAVLDAMGGRTAWEQTRFVSWRFFGRRLHYWDRHSGDIRIDSPASRPEDRVERAPILILINVHTRKGRAWEDGNEVTDTERRRELLEMGHQWWVNDSYWMFMPYKLLDPGVTLRYVGQRPTEAGQAADVLDLTFDDGVGYTPQNRYEVFVARETKLVTQWSFFAEAADAEPRFVLPWEGWETFGSIRLATGHGQGDDWEIAVHEHLPRSLFERP